MGDTVPPARGGCLSAYLIFMMIVNGIVALVYLVSAGGANLSPGLSGWVPIALALGSLVNLGLTVALWNWRLWAMNGFVVMALLAAAINWLSQGWLTAAFGLLAALVNLAVLAALITAAQNYPREWHVAGDTPHVIRLDHDAVLSGLAYVFVDDKVIFRRQRKLWDTGIEHAFKLEGRECLLRAVYRLWYYDYGLWVNGVRQEAVRA